MSMKFRVERFAVEATTDSETEFDATPLEESEETHRLKHKTIPCHVNRDDTRQIAHLQSRQEVERQWIKHTDLRQARTREKTREERIISSCQMRQIRST